jgi:flagellar basal body rod protein FlgG
MIQGLYNCAAATDGLEAWSNAIARNISASGSPGFKKELVSFDGIPFGTMVFSSTANRSIEQATMAPKARGGVDFEPGENNRTGDPLEFAIEGNGFFRLQRPDGEYVYTRDGQFHISPQGQLMSKQGFVLMSDSGPVQLLIDGGPFAIDAEGRVKQGDQEIGTISLYDFRDRHALHRTIGGFMVDPNRPQTADPAEEARVHQGSLERSNVAPLREMADLVTVTNSMQANHKVIQSLDGVMERLIQTLGGG